MRYKIMGYISWMEQGFIKIRMPYLFILDVVWMLV